MCFSFFLHETEKLSNHFVMIITITLFLPMPVMPFLKISCHNKGSISMSHEVESLHLFFLCCRIQALWAVNKTHTLCWLCVSFCNPVLLLASFVLSELQKWSFEIMYIFSVHAVSCRKLRNYLSHLNVTVAQLQCNVMHSDMDLYCHCHDMCSFLHEILLSINVSCQGISNQSINLKSAPFSLILNYCIHRLLHTALVIKWNNKCKNIDLEERNTFLSFHFGKPSSKFRWKY